MSFEEKMAKHPLRKHYFDEIISLAGRLGFNPKLLHITGYDPESGRPVVRIGKDYFIIAPTKDDITLMPIST